MCDTQYLGVDIGRGFIKVYSEYKGEKLQKVFNAVYGTGRNNVDFSEDSIALEIDGDSYFFGKLAIDESMNKTSNIRDSKVTDVAEKFLIAALNEVVRCKKVKIMFSAPNRDFSMETRQEIINKYKNKTYKWKDVVTGERKEVFIADVNALREADSALLFLERGRSNKEPVALISVGYKTTEFSYFSSGLKFISAKSTSIQTGARDVNSEVRKRLEAEKIFKDEAEIDLTHNYDNKKRAAYSIIENRIYEETEGLWGNTKEFENVYVVGGTSLNLNLDPKIFTKVDDPQICTAKGLYLMATRIFNISKKKA